MKKKALLTILVICFTAVAYLLVYSQDDKELQTLLERYKAFLPPETVIPPQIAGFIPSTSVNVMPDQPAFSGQTMTVWGNSNAVGTTYEWDFGDGTPVVTGSITDGHYIKVDHTYTLGTGVLFDTYTATLTVDKGGAGEASKQVNILVVDKTALPTDINGDGTFETELQISVDIAIQDGLEYLYLTQNNDGSWSGTGYLLGPTGYAVLTFENQGYLASQPFDKSIYAEYIQAGLNYLFTHARFQTLAVQPAGNPDPDGDGGLSFYSGYPIYETPMALMAIASTGTPNETVKVSPTDPVTYKDLNGQTYFEVAEDIVHYLAWAQNEGPNGRGGWRYNPNDGDSDNSNSQWPAIGLQAAERLFSVPI